jgi:hypothetical protein
VSKSDFATTFPAWGTTRTTAQPRRNHVAELSARHRLLFLFGGKVGASFYSADLEVRDAANDMALVSVTVTGTPPPGLMFASSAFDSAGDRMTEEHGK